MKTTKHRVIVKLLVSMLILLTACWSSCQKQSNDSPAELPGTLSFVDTTQITDGTVRQFARAILKQNRQLKFLEYFVQENGVPIWEQSIRTQNKDKAMLFVPFVKKGSRYITGFIKGVKVPDGNFHFEIYRVDLMTAYVNSPKKRELEPAMIRALFNHFNNAVFEQPMPFLKRYLHSRHLHTT
ncbi:hypothetical protein MKQ70_12575 [Chitinophaga sedimenti]|uniref:hypothetical protein n=1 Tax=Chitinophaga sedimenti TaxID=2033606 RepID=UPI0020058024|nr:hypothetical protein [Chitinophaga sedimenti]MCK7555807.1 hypothetical protein [Chitinophaga sedimenti]